MAAWASAVEIGSGLAWLAALAGVADDDVADVETQPGAAASRSRLLGEDLHHAAPDDAAASRVMPIG
jgi:hypothetical protein